MLTDTLAIIGLAALSLGTIREADGPVERTFLLRNTGEHAVSLLQGYTSCGCTSIAFAKGSTLAVGDTASVRLRFNPRGKSGEFFETGTLVYQTAATGEGAAAEGGNSPASETAPARKAVTLSLEGTCLSSDESLAQQFPIRITESLWISANRFDLGIMRVGESKERGVVILHRGETESDGQVSDRQELVNVRYTVDAQTPKGLQHVQRSISIQHDGRDITVPIILDVLVK
ncbi:MAG: DUF1573 domain-containing protein [Bacteroidales bacterium]|nr:DUF1573 domain-containing protein [Bacteroidales bacterium]